MSLPSNVRFEAASGIVCACLILVRCAYRLLFPCRFHKSCHRQWRPEDAYMTFALIPLAVRTVSIALCFTLNPPQSSAPVTAEEAAALGRSVDQLTHDRIVARKLLIPSRLSYALFLWTLKLSLLAFYSRFVGHLDWGRATIRTLWWTIVLSYIVVMLATLLECRPKCSKGLINLLTMASFNMVTDIALIILPFPMLRHIRLTLLKKIQLIVLFGVGAVVVVITITRIPLTLIQSVSQSARTMWASTEMLCACFVTNAAFYYKTLRDLRHHHQDQNANRPRAERLRLQSLPSSAAAAAAGAVSLTAPEPAKSPLHIFEDRVVGNKDDIDDIEAPAHPDDRFVFPKAARKP
ncbi:hypothetical protein ACRE_059100 [Hapsidospora chrysogenum ATCC 11550]|uniref:Rhodopsin domain-containing protein n=1 Tax=Hapsidospora chrysogenum (strain ATCC 11550 / CBS 779.69 / DSM 880 / IAM 14645 / JCM 23072 / IMI 49137) TaxID=857340 RepID=A0A086T1W0_HAPC1|nr:hypothetical protein ACRE_059100 [Hapsidospora chrysogenum ATCC 11550]